MSACALRKKLEITGKMAFLHIDGERKIPSSSVENISTAVVEASSHSLHGCVSASDVSYVLDMPYSTVQKVLQRILNFYSNKIKPVYLLQDGDSEVRKTFSIPLSDGG